jgi:ECF sigma factor
MDFVALDRALNTLAAVDPSQARLVELRYFGGLTIEERRSHKPLACNGEARMDLGARLAVQGIERALELTHDQRGRRRAVEDLPNLAIAGRHQHVPEVVVG